MKKGIGAKSSLEKVPTPLEKIAKTLKVRRYAAVEDGEW